MVCITVFFSPIFYEHASTNLLKHIVALYLMLRFEDKWLKKGMKTPTLTFLKCFWPVFPTAQPATFKNQ